MLKCGIPRLRMAHGIQADIPPPKTGIGPIIQTLRQATRRPLRPGQLRPRGLLGGGNKNKPNPIFIQGIPFRLNSKTPLFILYKILLTMYN